MSRELILRMSMSIDGFVAGPNGEGDWMHPTMSDAGRQWVAEQFGQCGLIAIGHHFYRDLAAFWITANMPIARPMNEIPKAVFSRSGAITSPNGMEKTAGADPAALESWLHPIVAGKDLVADIHRLKSQDGKPIIAIGGASFASSLVDANLVDEFSLAVHPVALGRGIPLFAGIEAPILLKLKDVKQFETGAMIKTYRLRDQI